MTGVSKHSAANIPKQHEHDFKTEVDGKKLEELTFVGFSDQSRDELDQAIANLVTSSEEVNNRRQSVNQFFLTINTLVLGGSAWIFSNFLQTRLGLEQTVRYSVAAMVLSLLGLFLCSIWKKFLNSFQCVSSSKIELMKTLEEKRTVRVFSAQYLLVNQNDYEPLTDLELEVAKVFIAVHAAIIFMSIGLTVARYNRWF